MQSLQYNGEKPLALGRIGLNAKGLEKWIHDDIQYPDRRSWLFHSNELWAPGRTACERINLPPDLYFGFRSESFYEAQNPSPYIVLANALDKGDDFDTASTELVTALVFATNAVQHCTKKTTWGRAVSQSSFTDAIGDLLCSSVQTW